MNLSKQHCPTCQETTVFRSLSCIHCDYTVERTVWRDEASNRAMAQRVAKANIARAKRTRVAA